MTRTTDSSNDARAILSGYGNPGLRFSQGYSSTPQQQRTMSINSRLQRHDWLSCSHGITNLLRNPKELALCEVMIAPTGPQRPCNRRPGCPATQTGSNTRHQHHAQSQNTSLPAKKRRRIQPRKAIAVMDGVEVMVVIR